MGYVYAAAWIMLAVLLLAKFRKESKAIYILSAYFFILSIWWFVNELVEIDLMHGTYAWILRILSAAALIIAAISYYSERKNSSSKKEEN